MENIIKQLIKEMVEKDVSENIVVNSNNEIDVDDAEYDNSKYDDTIFTDSRRDFLGNPRNTENFGLFKKVLSVQFPIIKNQFGISYTKDSTNAKKFTINLIKLPSPEIKYVSKNVKAYSVYTTTRAHTGGKIATYKDISTGVSSVKNAAYQKKTSTLNTTAPFTFASGQQNLTYAANFPTKLADHTIRVADNMINDLEPAIIIYPDTSSTFNQNIMSSINKKYASSEIVPERQMSAKFSFMTSFDDDYFDSKTTGYTEMTTNQVQTFLSTNQLTADQLPKPGETGYNDPKYDPIKKPRSRVNPSRVDLQNLSDLQSDLDMIKQNIEDAIYTADSPDAQQLSIRRDLTPKKFFSRSFQGQLTRSIKDLFYVMKYIDENSPQPDVDLYKEVYETLYDAYVELYDNDKIKPTESPFNNQEFSNLFDTEIVKLLGEYALDDKRKAMMRQLNSLSQSRFRVDNTVMNEIIDKRKAAIDKKIKNILKDAYNFDAEMYIKANLERVRNKYIREMYGLSSKYDRDLAAAKAYVVSQTSSLQNDSTQSVVLDFSDFVRSSNFVNKSDVTTIITRNGDITNDYKSKLTQTKKLKALMEFFLKDFNTPDIIWDNLINSIQSRMTIDSPPSFIKPALVLDDSLRSGTTIKRTIESLIKNIERSTPDTSIYEDSDMDIPIVCLVTSMFHGKTGGQSGMNMQDWIQNYFAGNQKTTKAQVFQFNQEKRDFDKWSKISSVGSTAGQKAQEYIQLMQSQNKTLSTEFLNYLNSL